jgi:hypothetical protein
VRAETKEDARKFAHEKAGDENRGMFLGCKTADMNCPWLDEKYSTCDELMADGEAGVVLQDFNAA